MRYVEMNDRELLELAAKAAGYEAWDWLGGDGLLNVYDANGRHDCWNPLTDDGDAFRLAVKLWIDVSFPPYREPDPPVVYAGMYWDVSDSLWYRYEELRGADPYAATRRAIVKAAAEIGRGMK
jgi:hypothetical protein